VEDRKNEVNLLVLEDKHYVLIKSLSRLLSSQTSNHNGKKHFCLRCLTSFTTKEVLEKHREYCEDHDFIKIVMPKKGETCKFKNHNQKMWVSIVVYADFECCTKKIHSTQPNPENSFSEACQKYEPSEFCFKIVCNGGKKEPVSYAKQTLDENMAENFVKELRGEIDKVWLTEAKPMIMIEEDKSNFDNATNCWICQKDFTEDDKKVRDHCHFSGQFQGAAHQKCNALFRKPKFVPVFFHNLSGYDAHLFVKNLNTLGDGDIDCIPNTEEKYISFSKSIYDENKKFKYKIRFLDSFRFMASGLDKLTANLNSEQLKHTREEFGEDCELLLRKGVFPYDWFDSFEKLNETKLPPKEAFYSKLYNSEISDLDCEYAQKVRNHFEMKTFRKYHDLYMKLDFLLLTEVFENFRGICMDNYELDSCWYFTAPGLAWDACLKKTGVELELLNDLDVHLMFEKGIRGGVSMISNRYAKANNKYMKNFDPSKPSKFIQYLDASNLYGWAMSQPLPVRNFNWMSEAQLENWKEFSDQDGKGCILEVDLEYPKELHDLHNDYPLAPERLMVNKVEKLIPNLNNTKRYVLHYHNLTQCREMKLKITKIHQGISFCEAAWMKPYIDLNTRLRAKAQNEFEKDFLKLMNNSVFGKTMENIRNRVDVCLRTNEKSAVKLVPKPNYERATIFDQNLIAVHMKKTELGSYEENGTLLANLTGLAVLVLLLTSFASHCYFLRHRFFWF